MIDLDHVSYSYDDIPALTDVSLHIDQGESVSLMGPNGCGKSTLLKILNGLYFPTSGTYSFDGEEISKKSLRDKKFEKRFHQRVGFVFQNPDVQMFCSSVYDEVAFGPRQMGLSEEEVQKRTEDCLTLLEIEKYRDRIPYHLSGGEKHKVAIACILSLNPDVIVMDEPMNGLDPRTRRWLAEFLVELHKAGKTIVVSTHDIELVNEITTRSILFAEDHTLRADMPTEQLLCSAQMLIEANLVDQYYHEHKGPHHSHFHDHE